jgi:hypothetical protein
LFTTIACRWICLISRFPQPKVMSMKTLLMFGTATLAAALSAQQTQTLPPYADSGHEGDSLTSALWSSQTIGGQTGSAMRHQMIYSREIVPTGTISITRLRWRANGSLVSTGGGTWSNVTIKMCTSAQPYTAPSSTFASNLGPDLTTVYTGPITVAATTPSFPNAFYVDIPLTTPFPFSGPGDLLIECSWAAGTYTGALPAPNTQSEDTDVVTFAGLSPAASVRSITSPTATTAQTVQMSAAIVVNFDYTPDPYPASKVQFGNSCNDSLYYELFSPATNFDLNNTAIRMQLNGIGGYDVSSIPLNFVPPVSANLPAGDDLRSVQTLPFPFPFPGSSTTQIGIVTNGFIWLDGTTTNVDGTPTVSEFLTQQPRLAVAWTDWDASAPAPLGSGNGSWHYDVISSTEVHVTWNGIGAHSYNSTLGGPTAKTFQCKMFANGAIEYHYVDARSPYYGRDCLVGIKPGPGTYADTGSRNLTTLALNSFITHGGTSAGLTLDVDVLPRVGTTINLVTTNIPATTQATAVVVAFSAVVPGLELTFLGMPGCYQNVALAGSTTLGLLLTSPSGSLPLSIPNQPVYLGYQVFSQSVAFVSGFNAFGALGSNGVRISIGH